MTQMPERDVSPATEAGRSFNGACGYDHTKRILAIEQEAAAIERHKVVERIRHRVAVEVAPTGNGQAARRVRTWLFAILDELSLPQRIDSMSNDEFEAFGRALDSAAAQKVRRLKAERDL